MNEPARSVLVVYDHWSKRVLRWVVPDYEHQVTDPAHLAAHVRPQLGEQSLKIRLTDYRAMKGLPDIQQYVTGNAP